MCDLSIIVPVYNCEEFLQTCINSLINQTLSNIEIIFINDGSKDKSLEILKDASSKDNRIVVINQQNCGVSSARNKGIDVAKGKYIGFVDPDDSIDLTMFEKMYNKILEQDSDLAICNYYEYHEKTQIKIPKKIIEQDRINDIKESVLENFVTKQNNGYVWNKIYKTSLIKENNINFNINITIREDLLFNMDYLDKCKSIVYIDEELYNYYIRIGTAVTKIHENRFYMVNYLYEKTIYYMKKWNMQDINNHYLKQFYSKNMLICCKEIIFDKKYSIKCRKNKIKDIISNKNFNYIYEEIISKNISVPYSDKIFFRITKRKTVLYLYLYLLNLKSKVLGNS